MSGLKPLYHVVSTGGGATSKGSGKAFYADE